MVIFTRMALKNSAIGKIIMFGSSSVLVIHATSFIIKTFHRCVFARNNNCIFCQIRLKRCDNKDQRQKKSSKRYCYFISGILNTILSFWTSQPNHNSSSIKSISKSSEENVTNNNILTNNIGQNVTLSRNQRYTPVYDHSRQDRIPPMPPTRSTSLKNYRPPSRLISDNNEEKEPIFYRRNHGDK